MVARLIEGWESSTTPADYTGKWSSFSAGMAIGPAYGRFGNGIRLTSAGLGTFQRTFDSQATWVVGWAVRVAEYAASPVALLTLLDGGTTHCGVALQATSGLLFAWRGTTATVLGTAAVAPAPETWAYLEAKLTIGDTGSVVVRMNGVTVLDLPTADTRNAGNPSANTVRFNLTGSTSVHTRIDDIYIFDGSGAVNADFAGDCKVEQVLPAAAGATTGWTPSAGSNHQCVDDADANEDTDYVSASTVVTDTYAFGDLSVATSGSVKVVQATAQARKDDAGSRSLALVVRPGSTDRVGTTQSALDTYTMLPQVWDTNPDTSAAWSVAEVNACEAGVRLIA